MSGWFDGADRAYRAASAVLLLRRLRGGLRFHPGFGAADPGPGAVVAGQRHERRCARPPHGVRGRLMVVGGVAELAAPLIAGLAGRGRGLFGLGTALVLDEFALILHLRDVYWSNEGRLSIDAVFVAAGVTALLLIGVSPVRRPGRRRATSGCPDGPDASPAHPAVLVCCSARRGHAAEGQDLDRAVRPVRAAAVLRRRAAAGPAATRPGPAGATGAGPASSPGPAAGSAGCACR